VSVTPPLQKRSRRTMERIVSATIDLLEVHAPADVSVQDIVSAANSSVGSFYARFESKDDLLEYVRARMWEDAAGRWREAREARSWDDLELGPLVRGLVKLFDQVESLNVRARESLGGVGDDEAARAFHREIESGALDLLLERKSEIGHGHAEEAARFAVRLGLAAVRQPGTLGQSGQSDDVERLASALTAYLRGSHGYGGDADEGDVEFFDIWG